MHNWFMWKHRSSWMTVLRFSLSFYLIFCFFSARFLNNRFVWVFCFFIQFVLHQSYLPFSFSWLSIRVIRCLLLTFHMKYNRNRLNDETCSKKKQPTDNSLIFMCCLVIFFIFLPFILSRCLSLSLSRSLSLWFAEFYGKFCYSAPFSVPSAYCDKKGSSTAHWFNRITFIRKNMCTLNHMVWLVIACTTKHSHHTDILNHKTPNQIISIAIIIKKAVPPELSYMHKLFKFWIIVANVSRGAQGSVRCLFFGCRISFYSNWLNGNVFIWGVQRKQYTIVFASTRFKCLLRLI